MAGFCAWGSVVVNETTFPDDVFRTYVLSSNASIDKNQDGVLSDDEIAEVTEIDVSEMGISSLQGIEYFTSLMTLYCGLNQLTELDVSKNTSLMSLECSTNQLTTLDVSKNLYLGMLGCGYNQLTALDVSKNTNLSFLEFTNNKLTAIDVSNNTNLMALGCMSNQLTELDVSKNTSLMSLNCSDNQLTTIDVSNNTSLMYLECGANQLTALDVSPNTALESLNCSDNQLTTIDVSKNTALTSLECGKNQMTAINLSGCSQLYQLFCNSNDLTALDLSECSGLRNLDCYGNQLTTLDVIKNTALRTLSCGYNNLTALDVSSNPALDWLECYGNPLKAIDVSKNASLDVLMCWDNDLTEIDVSKNTTLLWLDCSSNDLKTLDVSNNTRMTWLECFGDNLTALDVSKNTALEYLDCNTNQLSALDVTNNPELKDLHCHTNNISSLNLSNNPELMRLRCHNNKLMELDVSSNTKLVTLDCYSNDLPILDVSSHTLLDSKDFYLESLDVLYIVYRYYTNEPWHDSSFSSQTLALPKPQASGGTDDYPYTLNLNTVAASRGVNFNFEDFLTHASSFTITDSSDNTVNRSADVSSGTVYFSSMPAKLTYVYDTQYSGSLSPAPVMDVTVNFSPLEITLTNAVQTITAGSAISPITYTVANSLGSLSVDITALPSGITQSGNTFSGTISDVGTYSFTITVTDMNNAETASATATITVNTPSGISEISITSPEGKSITLTPEGGSFSASLSASGAPYGSIVWSASATQGLSADISGSGSTATLSGTAQPNTSSQDISGTITVAAHDNFGIDYYDTLTVIVSGLTQSTDITSGDITTITGIAFTPNTLTLSSDGGQANFTASVQGTPSGDVSWSVSPADFSVTPAAGLTVSITGRVPANTTSASSAHTVRVTARDSVNAVSADFTVTVAGRRSSEEHQDPSKDETSYYEQHTGDTSEDAYVMGSPSDFIELVSKILDGSESEGKYYAINTDIDMSALSDFQSIGSESNPFRGHFDGGGKTITIPANVRGLFGLVDTDGIAIQDLNVRTVPSLYNGASGGTPPTDYAGGIVQELVNGTITGCTFTGTVTADGTDSAAGGIVGLLSGGTVQNCRVLSGSGIYASHSAGGIVGYVMAGSVSNCTSDADVDAEFSGGIAGYTEAERRNITANSYTIAVVEVGNDELSIGLLPVSQTVRAGTAITDIQVSSDNAASWSFRVSGDYALGLTSRDMVISGTIPAWTQAGRYTITVNALNSNGFTASAQAYITVVSLLESGDVISGDIISGDVISGDQRPTPSTPGGRDNPVDYVFDIPAGIRDRVTMHFNNETIYQFTADEIISAAWELDAVDLRAIADLYESVVLRLPILRPKNTGLYMLRLDLSGAGAGKKINLYGITSGGGGNLSTTALENMDYMLLDENGNEVTQVPENGIVYAVLRLTANREHRGVITSPIELERGSIQPVKAEELGNTVLEKIAESVNISADQIKFITEENISDPQEPTENMRSELESRQNQIIGKFNTLYVRESGYYVFRVTLSDDLYEQVKGVSINELKVYALFDDGRPSSADVRASFVSGLLSTWELLSLNGEKLEFGVKEFLMVGFLNASTPLSVYLTKLIIMLLLGGCDAGLGIAGLAVTALGAIFFIVRRKH